MTEGRGGDRGRRWPAGTEVAGGDGGRWRGRRSPLLAAVLLGAALASAPAQVPADTILVNGQVITVDARFSIAQAVAITGGKFTAVGTSADIRKLAGPSTTVIDLKGRTVITDLAEDHLHVDGGGSGVDF